LNAEPLRAANMWLTEYETLWGESLGGLKRYIEETEQRKKKNL
jgi:hypothetical protein